MGEALRFPRSAGPHVSFLVPTTRRADTLEACLRGLAREAAGEIPCELVIVLDAATPEVRAIVGRVVGATVVNSRVHVGVVGGYTLARDAASGSVLAFVHDDTFGEPGWLRRLLAGLDEPAAGIAGPAILQAGEVKTGTVVWRCGRTSAVPEDLGDSEPFPVDATGMSTLLMQAATYDSIAGVDMRYYPYGYTDVDLCTQVRAAGRSVLIVPGARVHHHSEMTSSIVRRSFFAGRTHALFAHKWAAELEGHVPLDLDNMDRQIVRALERSWREAEVAVLEPPAPRPRRPIDRAAFERACLEADLVFHRELAEYLEELLEQK